MVLQGADGFVFGRVGVSDEMEEIVAFGYDREKSVDRVVEPASVLGSEFGGRSTCCL